MSKNTNSAVTAKVVRISPQLATTMLERNTLNRALSDLHVQRLAAEMKAGHWKLNGDTIRFSGDRLVDGQHRLWAIIESGCTIEVLVVEGLDDGVFDTIDIGKGRSHADTLSVLDEDHPAALAAALKVVDRYERGLLSSSIRYTNSEVIALLNKHPQIRRSIEVCGYQAGLVPPSMKIAAHYLFQRKSVEEADTFIRDFKSGASLGEDDPVHRVRERFVAMSAGRTRYSMRCDYVMACMIRAWNARREGRLLKRLQISDEDLRSDTFQEIK